MDLPNVPRTAEPETKRRWLYTWKKKEEADSFAGELKRRTRDNSWYVYSFEAEKEERGPVAPIDIYATQDSEGFTYALRSDKPGTNHHCLPSHEAVPESVLFHPDTARFIRQHGDNWGGQVCKLLTGLTDEQVRSLGGYRIFQTEWRGVA